MKYEGWKYFQVENITDANMHYNGYENVPLIN